MFAESQDLQQRHAEPHRRYFIEHAHARSIPLASHDDTTPEHVVDAYQAGIAVSEFPTTREAARTARQHSMGVVMGAPNVVRGGSHSGNVSAASLAREGLLDALSSDYVPSSLLNAAFMLIDQCGFSVSQAINTISLNPARCLELEDCGEIAVGKRADFSRVRRIAEMHSIMAVWRAGKRVV